MKRFSGHLYGVEMGVAYGGLKPKFKDIFNQDVINWFYEKINHKV